MAGAYGYAAEHKSAKLKPIGFERRMVGPTDVRVDIAYFGVCHSDLHQVRNDWGNTVHPCMPGHELVGLVAEVGANVTRSQVGDKAGVGFMVNSCKACPSCREGLEQYCDGPKGWTATYNGPQKPDGTNTCGGYSFCATHGVVPDVEIIAIDGIKAAFDKLLKGEPAHRSVIDMATLKGEAAV